MIELDPIKRATLVGIADSAGLKLVYELLEAICTESENELLGEPPWSPEIQGKHAVAYAQGKMITRLKEVIKFHVAEHRGVEES